MEADLLGKLQETQKQERDAFVQLESAMVDASIPKAMREKAGTSFNSTNPHTAKSANNLAIGAAKFK
jgi:hypothetical protein